MNIKYIFNLLLVSSMILQAPPKFMPDFKAIEARKRLQEKLKQKADVSTTEGRATLARVKLSQEENAQASQAFVSRMLKSGHKKNDASIGHIPQIAQDATSDQNTTRNICDILGGKPISSKRKLKEIVKSATANAHNQ